MGFSPGVAGCRIRNCGIALKSRAKREIPIATGNLLTRLQLSFGLPRADDHGPICAIRVICGEVFQARRFLAILASFFEEVQGLNAEC